MSRTILKPMWSSPKSMLALGFRLVSSKEKGQYLKFHNIAGHKIPSYGPACRGMQVIYFNRGYSEEGVFVNIRMDGDTRTQFNGVIDTEILFKQILNSVR